MLPLHILCSICKHGNKVHEYEHRYSEQVPLAETQATARYRMQATTLRERSHISVLTACRQKAAARDASMSLSSTAPTSHLAPSPTSQRQTQFV